VIQLSSGDHRAQFIVRSIGIIVVSFTVIVLLFIPRILSAKEGSTPASASISPYGQVNVR
jgi:hypothetical protein